jgi:hypothetical protein
MGDFADMAIDEGLESFRPSRRRNLPFWPSEAMAGRPLHPAHTEKPKTCQKCGKGWLFWQVINGAWRLHHYALLPGETEPGFVLHRCGFTSDGKHKASATEAGTAETGTGSVHEGAASEGGTP